MATTFRIRQALILTVSPGDQVYKAEARNCVGLSVSRRLEPVRFRWNHLKRINRLALICLERDGRFNRYPLEAVTL